MNLPVVGVDISKNWFDICIPSVKLKVQLTNDLAGFKKFLRLLKKHRIAKARVCMEATGLYFEALAEFMHNHGNEVVVVNPQCIKSYSRSELRRCKTDPLDAALIAQFCEDKYSRLNLWAPIAPSIKAARELLRRRASLIADRTAEKCRLKAGFSNKETLQSIAQHIAWLDREIKQLEMQAKEVIALDPELLKAVLMAETIKGVGWLTAATILVEIPQILWSGRLAAAFAGVIPQQKKSGTSMNTTRLSRVGSEHLRAAMYMPAKSASRTNPILKPFYERLRARGLKHKQALTAVMRKLLHLVFGVIRSGQSFDPLYEKLRREKLA